MIIEKNLSRYIVFSEDSIITALKKISDNKSGIVFSVSESGVLEGVLTDGDIRRWLVGQEEIDLNQPVFRISNKQYRFVRSDEDPDRIQKLFSEKIRFVPLLDGSNRLVAIACASLRGIKIGRHSIDSESPVFVIAEIGNNHNGSIDTAKKLIDEAVAAGADCVKFQMRHLDQLYSNAGNANDASEDLGSQYVLDLLTRFQLAPEQMFEAFAYCRERNILPLCTPWDLESLALLERRENCAAYKVASADLTNHDLLKALAQTGKPLICSTGMSTEEEITEAVALLKRLGGAYILLHCNSTYPTPFKDVNLNYLDRLKEIGGGCPIGYSGHERGFSVVIAAVAKGAKVVEKHLTLDKSLEGNDHKISLLPAEFAAMVRAIRETEQACGMAAARSLSQGEMINREILAKSLVIRQDLRKGQIITADMIDIKSPGRGIQPNRKNELIGTRAKRDLKAGDFFFRSDLVEECITPRTYAFKRPWGIPVRYHDYRKIAAATRPDILEFHLSYKDMEQDVAAYFGEVLDMDLVVHSPELFAGDHLLDLCARNPEYRRRSVLELQRVIDVTKTLQGFFGKSARTCIVTNCGGFTDDAPLSRDSRKETYDILLDSLSHLDTADVEIIPQTMPPFPWHFGGQRYHNLFVHPEETAEFCSSNDYRICLDTSHSKLACNHWNLSFKEFVRMVGPHTAHLHLADADGIDGEGLQIGAGTIDFPALAEDIDATAPQASFIPEIWQGHKNEGEGFWIALDRLEKWF